MTTYNKTPDIMNVKEMIDITFGSLEGNVVNFKLLQTIIFLLARQLRLLERRVEVEWGPFAKVQPSSSTLSVTEVKIHALQKKSKISKGDSGVKDSSDKGQKTIRSSDKISVDKTPSNKSSIERMSSNKTTDKTFTGITSTDKTSTSKTTSSSKEKSSMSKSSGGRDKSQSKRTDSFNIGTKTPTPMASVTSVDAQYEKILVVERVSSTSSKSSGKTPQVSVVTQEQFERLANIVHHLQTKLIPVGKPGFPNNLELMEELRKGASLTDAMAALQLSARLEAVENGISRLITMINEIAKQTSVEIDETPFTPGVIQDTGGMSYALDSEGPKGGAGKGAVNRGTSSVLSKPDNNNTSSQPTSSDTKSQKQQKGRDDQREQDPDQDMINIVSADHAIETTFPHTVIKVPDDNRECITYEILEAATKELYDHLNRTMDTITTRTNATADNAQKLALSLEGKVKAALGVTSRMTDLENIVQQYAEKINALDTGLSSQMTYYQEQLTQMQHDLEIGLETMAEALANTGGDTVAVAELNTNFSSLQMDFDNMSLQQKDLKDGLNSISIDLESLWRQIEMLRESKSDRDEVTDALRDKAGIGQLNGLVSLEQFHAVQGEFEERISSAYNKFNNQELVWQKAIDELMRTLNEKADIVQVQTLRDEIKKHLDIMRARMQTLIDIVGEPKSAMLSRKLFRDTACLSCGSPAHMDIEGPNLIPEFPRFHLSRQPGDGAQSEKASKTIGDGDGICYPGLPLPHPRDLRSHLCQRYCGGSHTLVPEAPRRVPPANSAAIKNVTLEPGTDGKMYKVDVEPQKIPCVPCSSEPNSKQTADNLETSGNIITINKESATDIHANKNYVSDSDTPPAHDFIISE